MTDTLKTRRRYMYESEREIDRQTERERETEIQRERYCESVCV